MNDKEKARVSTPVSRGNEASPLNTTRTRRASRRVLVSLVAAVVLTVLVLPAGLGGYWLRVLTVVFVFAIMAQAVNIIAGYAGYAALGNAVFFGTGAYVVAVLMTEARWAFAPALVVAALANAALAMILGLPILRLSGRYFLMATLGLMEITREIVLNLEFTGGAQGITLPVVAGTPMFANRLFYYLSFGILVLAVATTWWIQRNNIGLALRAIKFDEEAARTMGVNTTWYKTVAWSISAFFTALAGGVYAYYLSYIEPATVYEIATTVRMYIEHIFGGAGSVFGPVLGAGVLELLSEVVWARFTEIHYLVLGALVILITLFVPKGLIVYLRKVKVDSLIARVVSATRKAADRG